MKRNLTLIITAITALLILSPAVLNAQEEKEKEVEKKIERKIRIVTVDKSGEKTIIDTTITGDSDIEEIQLGKGMKWVMEDKGHLNGIKTKEGNLIIITGEKSEGENEEMEVHIDENIIYTKDGNIMKKSSGREGHTFIVKVDEDGEKEIEWVEQSTPLKDGQVHIVIHSNNEVEELIIDGDAVITIKDGKVMVDSEGLKMNVKEEGKGKEIKGKKIKKEKMKR